jgi:hypothetical protein
MNVNFNEQTGIPRLCTVINGTVNNGKTLVITFGFSRPETPQDVIALGTFALDKDLSLKLEELLHTINKDQIK